MWNRDQCTSTAIQHTLDEHLSNRLQITTPCYYGHKEAVTRTFPPVEVKAQMMYVL